MKLSELLPRLSTAPHAFRDELVATALTKPEPWRSESSRIYLTDKDYRWYLHEGDLWLDGTVTVDIPLLVTGDLIISGTCADTYGGMLLILGNMRCAHLVAGQAVCVWGDLICGGLCYQYYNDWVLEVQGTLSARAFISEDKDVSAREWKADAYFNSHDCTSGADALAPYRILGYLPEHYEDEDEEEDEDTDEASNRADKADATLPSFPSYDACAAMLEERQTEVRDAFVEPLPPFAEIVARWGEDWAWRKRLWYPYRPAVELTDEERTGLGTDWLFEVIASGNMPAEAFAELSTHREARIRWALATSPVCPAPCIDVLAKDTDASVRAAVAGRQECPPALRAELTADPNWTVRVASLFGCHEAPYQKPDDTALERLANDPEPRVRRVVAAVPRLPRPLVDKLTNDPDSTVVARVSRFQPLDVSVFERQADDAAPSVRASAADHVRRSNAPFDMPENKAVANRILQKLMLDSDPGVRAHAANGWQPFPFYEQHAEAMSQDELEDIRRILAWITRQPRILARLAEDEAPSVCGAVAENPNTPAETLIAMARDLKVPMVAIFNNALDTVNLANALSNNPRLPHKAIEILMKKEFEYNFFEDQPNLSPEQMVERLEFDADDEDAEAYQKCRAFFPWMKVADRMTKAKREQAVDVTSTLLEDAGVMNGRDEREHWSKRLLGWAIERPKWIALPVMMVAVFGMMMQQRKAAKAAAKEVLKEAGDDPAALREPDGQAISALFTHMLSCGVYSLRAEALKNAHCPPEALLDAVRHYLAHAEDDDKGGLGYTIRDVAANPGLPAEARGLLIAHLTQRYDHEVCKGLVRNLALAEAEWRKLAEGAHHPDNRRDFARALWSWHGATVQDATS